MMRMHAQHDVTFPMCVYRDIRMPTCMYIVRKHAVCARALFCTTGAIVFICLCTLRTTTYLIRESPALSCGSPWPLFLESFFYGVLWVEDRELESRTNS